MKKKTGKIIVGLIAGLIIIVAVVGVWISYNQERFVGERVCNSDGYTLSFEIMNQTDSHSLELKEGDRLAVDFAIDKGRIDVTIGKDGEEPIYRGDDLKNGGFFLDIREDGEYTITVNAKHAAGLANFYVNAE